MAKYSKIEWTHHTFNPWWGCERVSPACKNCYAETWAHRLGLDLWRKSGPRRMLSEANWHQPVTWNREAEKSGKRARVFCASMADVFEDRRDLDQLRERLWALIHCTPSLDWLLLTKRPQHVGRLSPWGTAWPTNVWLGTTVENQRWADKRVPILLSYPARVRFLSCEPLLGPLNLRPWTTGKNRIDWVIAGGESGHRARPTNPEWLSALRDQCLGRGVAFHFKQWGNWRPASNETHRSRTRLVGAERIVMVNVGKKAAGRTLDGRKWDELPAVA
jgi:protein gp37